MSDSNFKTCEVVPRLDLASGFPEDAFASLSGADSDQDGSVDFSEAQGMEFFLPVGGEKITIVDESDWEVYAALVESEFNSRAGHRFAPESVIYASDTAESWYAGLRLITGMRKPLVSAESALLWDYERANEGTRFLVEIAPETPGATHFVSLFLPRDTALSLDSIRIEINGSERSLAAFLENNFFDLATVFCLISLWVSPEMEFLTEDEKAALGTFELAFYRAKQGAKDASFARFKDSGDSAGSVADSVSPDRQKAVLDGLNASRGVLTLGGNEIPVFCESELEEAELRKLESLVSGIPSGLPIALAKNGTLPSLSVEIVEDEVMDALAKEENQAIYKNYSRKILLRRSSLENPEPITRSILIHELAHALFPNDYDKDHPSWESLATGVRNRYWEGMENANSTESASAYFIRDTYEKALNRAHEARDAFPLVSLYAAKSVAEFLSENVVAYYLDSDALPELTRPDPFFGSRSREELASHHPELFIALRLFLEPSSPYCGRLSLFDWDSRAKIDAMLAVSRSEPLSALPLSELVRAYDLSE